MLAVVVAVVTAVLLQRQQQLLLLSLLLHPLLLLQKRRFHLPRRLVLLLHRVPLPLRIHCRFGLPQDHPLSTLPLLPSNL